MGHIISIDAIVNTVFGLTMASIGVIIVAQTASRAWMAGRSIGRFFIHTLFDHKE
jgi:hypothetical protein